MVSTQIQKFFFSCQIYSSLLLKITVILVSFAKIDFYWNPTGTSILQLHSLFLPIFCLLPSLSKSWSLSASLTLFSPFGMLCSSNFLLWLLHTAVLKLFFPQDYPSIRSAISLSFWGCFGFFCHSAQHQSSIAYMQDHSICYKSNCCFRHHTFHEKFWVKQQKCRIFGFITNSPAAQIYCLIMKSYVMLRGGL